MIKRTIFAFVAVLLLTACSGNKPKLMGLDGTSVPPAFSHFPDIPFPDRSYVDLSETRALGSGETWTGSLVFTAPYDSSSVFDFYMSEMPKLNWVEVATVRATISHMTYIRGDRAVQILVQNTGWFFDESRVTITAIPNRAKGRF